MEQTETRFNWCYWLETEAQGIQGKKEIQVAEKQVPMGQMEK